MINSAKISGTSDRDLIFIHGRDFKPPADDLLDICIAAIKAGIKRDYPAMVDRYHALGKQLVWYGDLNEEVRAESGARYDAALDIGDRRNVLQALVAIDKRKNFGVHRYDRLPGKTAVAEFAADVVAPVLGKLGLSNAMLGKLCSDFVRYWEDGSEFSGTVKDRLRQAIVDTFNDGKHIMLVSHGTGCVVAYDVLWELSHDERYQGLIGDHKIDVWLTLGAPLGDSMVQSRLLGVNSKGRRKYPSNVVSWYNVSAEDDYLCHDNTLADDFRGMLTQKLVSTIRDYRIYNLAVRYGKSNPHSSIGYLIHPRIAQLVSNWLKQGPAAQEQIMNTGL